jgi:hypothetical protein
MSNYITLNKVCYRIIKIDFSVFVAGMLYQPNSTTKKSLCSVEDFPVHCDGKEYFNNLINYNTKN